MAGAYLSPIPGANPTKYWTDIEDWSAEPNIQAKDLDSLQNCYDALHFPPYGPGSRLADEINAWLCRTLTPTEQRSFAGLSFGEKRLRTVGDQGFFVSITQRWGAAFNIPPDSRKFHNILYSIVKLKINSLTKPSRRRGEPRQGAAASPLPQPPLTPAAAPAMPIREPEAEVEIEFVAADGGLLGGAFVRLLRREDVEASKACIESIDAVKFLNHIEDICDVDPSSIVLRHHYPAIPALHDRMIRTRQNMLVTEMWRAYSHRDRQGPITVRLEPQQAAAVPPASKRAGSPSLAPATEKRQKTE